MLLVLNIGKSNGCVWFIKRIVFKCDLFCCQTVKGGVSETRIEKRIVISGDADIDHDEVRITPVPAFAFITLDRILRSMPTLIYPIIISLYLPHVSIMFSHKSKRNYCFLSSYSFSPHTQYKLLPLYHLLKT